MTELAASTIYRNWRLNCISLKFLYRENAPTTKTDNNTVLIADPFSVGNCWYRPASSREQRSMA
jgi:hypothetical protein